MLRIAEKTDKQAILAMSVRFAEDSPWNRDGVDVSIISNTIDQFLNGDKEQLVIILSTDENNNITGMLAALTAQFSLSTNKFGVAKVIWVEPEQRSKGYGLELEGAFEFWCKQVGCSAIVMNTINTELAPDLEKLYEKLGFNLVEKAFIKWL